jgi:hypothetical protein
VHPDCKWLIKNLQSCIFDKESIVPKLKKDPFQHGIDGVMHLVHGNSGDIDFVESKVRSANPYENQNEMWS